MSGMAADSRDCSAASAVSASRRVARTCCSESARRASASGAASIVQSLPYLSYDTRI